MDDNRNHQPLDTETNSDSSADSWILIEDGDGAVPRSEAHAPPNTIDDCQEANDEQIVSSTTTTYEE